MTEQQAPKKEDKDVFRMVWAVVVALVAFGALTTLGILYTDHKAQQADQRWCELFVGLDDNYRAAPRGTLPARTQKFADQIHKLRQDLGCPDTPVPIPQPAPSASPSG